MEKMMMTKEIKTALNNAELPLYREYEERVKYDDSYQSFKRLERRSAKKTN
jgi:hypothetical protein